MDNFVAIAFFVSIGILCSRGGILPADAAQTLNLFALYLSLPALILLQAPKIVFDSEALLAALLPWAALLLAVVFVLLASRYFHWPRSIVGVLLLLVPLGNTSFLGVPVIESLFGREGLSFLVIYDQFGTMAIFATYGSLILALYGRQGKINIAATARRVLLFPPTLALAAGLTLRTTPYPESLTRLLEALAATLVPLVMTAIGLQMRAKLERRVVGPLAFGLTVKLILIPVLLCAGCYLNGGGLAAAVSVVEAGMPPMVTAGALAVVAGLEAELAVTLVGFGMVCSFVTLPLLFLLTQVLL